MPDPAKFEIDRYQRRVRSYRQKCQSEIAAKRVDGVIGVGHQLSMVFFSFSFTSFGNACRRFVRFPWRLSAARR
jgi:hypothetical protein